LGWNEGILRALTWANQERGTDSVGFFDSSGKMVKCAETPSDALRKANISRWLDASCNGSKKLERDASWFIAGHTRMATRGKVNRQNSHPFRYGRIIGSHNGMIDAPTGYVVDSQHLFDTLHKSGNDYNAAWAAITGYWAVTWFDDHAFYMQVHNGDLTVARKGNVWYYSSSWAHLESCIGDTDELITLSEGQTLQFTFENMVVVVKEVEKFVSAAPDYWTKRYGCSNTNEYETEEYYGGRRFRRHNSSNKGSWYDNHSSDSSTTTTPARDYDAEWREAWEAYSSESEHLVT
jgi:hypothetical protein